MIVAISYHDGDRELMKRWANHVEKLGPYPNHKIIVAPVRRSSTEGIIEPLERCFGGVRVEWCTHMESGWPLSCNMAFETIAWAMELTWKVPFLFMEPDAIPLKKGWIDAIEAEYKACGKPFMGDYVDCQSYEAYKNVPNHMSGIAVYTNDLSIHSPSIYRNERLAWDIASARDVVPRMHRTHLIQHDFDTKNNTWRRDNVTKDLVRSDAVIYHPDKKGVLMEDSPNGTQGDPAAGGDLVAHKPHETKEVLISSKEIPAGTPESEEQAILKALNILSFHASISHKNKKKIKEWLCERGFSSKAKSSVKSRKKVRSNLGKHKRTAIGSGIQVPSNEEVES